MTFVTVRALTEPPEGRLAEFDPPRELMAEATPLLELVAVLLQPLNAPRLTVTTKKSMNGTFVKPT
jgi:hypothetical protein